MQDIQNGCSVSLKVRIENLDNISVTIKRVACINDEALQSEFQLFQYNFDIWL